MITLNINDTVRVKLTDHGRAIHAADHASYAEFRRARNLPPICYVAPTEDAEGWSEWQLWSLIKMFGQYIYLGCDVPFETTIELVEPKQSAAPGQDPMDAVRAMCK